MQPFMPDRAVVTFDISVLMGLPGWMWLRAMPCFSAQILSVELMYSGLLAKTSTPSYHGDILKPREAASSTRGATEAPQTA